MSRDFCPSCRQPLPVGVLTAGGPVRCPHCGDSIASSAAGATLTVVPPADGAVPPTDTAGPAAEARATTEATAGPRLPSIPGYELLEVVGRGGMGIVYKARQLSPRRIVALKMILGSTAPSARFQTEVSAVARLQHPNVVQIHEVGEIGGRAFFSMEFVSGGSLEAYLRRGEMPTPVAAALVAQLARAVQHAHERGIVHRDLKPANILIGNPQFGAQATGQTPADESRSVSREVGFRDPRFTLQPKIADFGLAKHLEGPSDGAAPLTQSGAILGTPNYMSPEQAKGKVKTVGPAADIWALGGILYECLAGRPPFREEADLDTMMKIISEEPPSLRQRRSAVPRDLEVICLKCLRKAPTDRYPSAGQLADDLDRFLDGRPIQARPRTTRERVGGWLRRRRELLFLAAGAALIVCLALATVNWWPPPSSLPTTPQDGQVGPLSPDLRVVPPDAYAFATVRVADLWNNPLVREMIEHLNRRDKEFSLDSFGLEIERTTSIHPTNLERVTFVQPKENNTGLALIILSTIQPYSHERLRDMLARGGQHLPQPVGARTMYVPKVAAKELAFFAASAHILLLGDALLVAEAAENPDRGSGLLTPLLERAAKGSTVVVGSHPSPATLAQWLTNDLRLGPESDSLALLQTIGVSLEVSQPKGPNRRVAVGVAIGLGFPGPGQAEAARPHAATLVRTFSDRFLAAPEPIPDLLALLMPPVKGATWECEGDTLRATAQIGAELAAVKAVVDGMELREKRVANMSQIARAMRHYHDKHGRFPPAVVTSAEGQPLYSWRVLLLPYLDGEAVYRKFHLNRPWDHPNNRPLLEQMPPVFATPGARPGNTTSYQVLTGAGGLFDNAEGRGLSEINDGAARTLLFVEAREPVPWTQPSDVAFDLERTPKLGGLSLSGFHAALADGTVRHIRLPDMPTDLLRSLFTRAGGDRVSLPP